MLRRFVFMSTVALTAIFVMAGTGFSAESEVAKSFIDAFEKNDAVKMGSIVKDNKDKIPAEIKSIIDEAMLPGIAKDDRDSKLYIAEYMAKVYKDTTGDFVPLKDAKKKIFETKLTPAIKPAEANGVYIIETPKPTEKEQNFFRPDNIIIKKGSTVRWVNNDVNGHIFASMPFIGDGGIFSPTVNPGESWEHKFEKPGEYYYLCFIHQSMIGKITVEE